MSSSDVNRFNALVRHALAHAKNIVNSRLKCDGNVSTASGNNGVVYSPHSPSIGGGPPPPAVDISVGPPPYKFRKSLKLLWLLIPAVVVVFGTADVAVVEVGGSTEKAIKCVK